MKFKLKHPSPKARRVRCLQSGFTLIEILISVLIFALGVLALVGLQASAVRFSTDAQQRAEATFLANQLLARMLITESTAAASFNHMATGTTPCAPTGSASTNASVLEWLDEVTETFPLADAADQQIIVSGSPANEVTVRLCWQNGVNDTPHTIEVSNRVQWQ